MATIHSNAQWQKGENPCSNAFVALGRAVVSEVHSFHLSTLTAQDLHAKLWFPKCVEMDSVPASAKVNKCTRHNTRQLGSACLTFAGQMPAQTTKQLF